LDAAAIQRYARQITLPEIGADGQERICRARVVVAGGDLAAETAARYLEAAGVGTVIELGTLPDGGEAWMAALDGAALVVRSGFDDDAMLGATKRLALPAVIVRGRATVVDLVSFPARAPLPDAPFDPARPSAEPVWQGASAVVAGTLAAAEALHVLAGQRPPGGAHVLRLPLDGKAPEVQEIPWR
jgi:hypothetical protein